MSDEREREREREKDESVYVCAERGERVYVIVDGKRNRERSIDRENDSETM